MKNKYTVKMVSNRTGLSPQLIRAWESRYNAVKPERSATNRRMYSEIDLEKLILLKRATVMGLAISTIAHLSVEELYELLDKRTLTEDEFKTEKNKSNTAAHFHVERCLVDIKNFDYASLESNLLNASSALGQTSFIEKVVEPLMVKTGENWAKGDFQVCQEHMVSSIIRSILGSMLVSSRSESSGPIILITTPNKQIHELGALISALTAISLGWNTIYLGPNMPTEDIAKAAAMHQADVIALSITIAIGDAALDFELQKLRKIVGNDVSIIIGGQGALSYTDTFKKIHAVAVSNLNEFKEALNSNNTLSGMN
ncbi:MAG: MerR family transcriptional regulator [Calditrichaeota bacterium]|nr:MAG: MerR family transcriptional regulator [Calditrichota bacterium]